jgi:hypothetical protein
MRSISSLLSGAAGVFKMRTCSCAQIIVSVLLATAAAAQRPSPSVAAEASGDRSSASRCREAMRRGLNDGATMYRAGLCFELVRDFVDAANAYREAIDLGFQPATTTARLASIFLITGQSERALDEMRRSPTQACADSKMHQLDFWIGEWEVRSGRHPAGTSSIEAVLGGCALIKKWSSDTGETSLTVFFYDPATGRWHEDGATSNGDILEAAGDLREGAMHFSGIRPIRHRSTVSPPTPMELREKTETSVDCEGVSWTALHDLIYIRRE